MDRVVRNDDDVGRQTANHNDVRVVSQTDHVNLEVRSVAGSFLSELEDHGIFCLTAQDQQPAGYFMLYFCIFRASNGLLDWHVVSICLC